MPKYPGLLSANVTLILPIATKSYSNIFCEMYLGFDVRFNYPFPLLTSLSSVLFLKFSIVLPYTALFINLYNVLSSTYTLSHCDSLNSNTRCTFFSFRHTL